MSILGDVRSQLRGSQHRNHQSSHGETRYLEVAEGKGGSLRGFGIWRGWIDQTERVTEARDQLGMVEMMREKSYQRLAAAGPEPKSGCCGMNPRSKTDYCQRNDEEKVSMDGETGGLAVVLLLVMKRQLT